MSNFSNSQLISLTNLSPHRSSPRNQPITKITIHHTAGNIGLEALGDWLARPGTRASYNYGISSDGRIGLFVNERDRCWGSSSAANDNRAVVIGVANNGGGPGWPVSDAAFDSLINLCADICRRNSGIVQVDGLPGLTYNGTASGSLTRHNMFSNQTCPGMFLQSRFPEICSLVNARLKTAPAPEGVNLKIGKAPAGLVAADAPPQPPAPAQEPSEWAQEAWAWATEAGITNGARPRDSITRQEAVTMLHRLEKHMVGTIMANLRP